MKHTQNGNRSMQKIILKTLVGDERFFWKIIHLQFSSTHFFWQKKKITRKSILQKLDTFHFWVFPAVSTHEAHLYTIEWTLDMYKRLIMCRKKPKERRILGKREEKLSLWVDFDQQGTHSQGYSMMKVVYRGQSI